MLTTLRAKSKTDYAKRTNTILHSLCTTEQTPQSAETHRRLQRQLLLTPLTLTSLTLTCRSVTRNFDLCAKLKLQRAYNRDGEPSKEEEQHTCVQ